MIETQQRAGANASPLLSFVTWVARTLGATHTPGAPRRDYIDLQLSVMRRRGHVLAETTGPRGTRPGVTV